MPLCRVCLNSSGNIPLFDGRGKDDQFRFCTSLEVQEEDGLPAKLCKKCNDHLKVAYDFRFQAIYAEKYFRKTKFLPFLKKESNNTQSHENGEGLTSIELDENMQEIEKLLANDNQIICSNIETDNNCPGKSVNTDDLIPNSGFCEIISNYEKPQALENPQLVFSFGAEKECKIETTTCTKESENGKQIFSIDSACPMADSQIHERSIYISPPKFESSAQELCFTNESESTKLHQVSVTSAGPKTDCHYDDSANIVINFSTYYDNQLVPADHSESYNSLQDSQAHITLSGVYEINDGTSNANYNCEQTQYSAGIQQNDVISQTESIVVPEAYISETSANTADLGIESIPAGTSAIVKSIEEQNEDILGPVKAKKRSKHPKSKKESIECNICGTVFTHINSLKTHLLKHSGEKPFNCEYCQKAFARKTVLNIHRRLHTGEKPYKCHTDKCFLAFVTKEALSRHLQKDHGEGKHFRKDKVAYICSICNKSRCSKYSLAAHMRTHAEGRFRRRDKKKRAATELSSLSSMTRSAKATLKYCKVCQQGFPNKWELSAHAELHNLNKIFECDICSRKFEKKFQLLYHLQTHDGADEIIRKKVRSSKKITDINNVKNMEKHRQIISNEDTSDEEKLLAPRRRRGRPKGLKIKTKKKIRSSEDGTVADDSVSSGKEGVEIVTGSGRRRENLKTIRTGNYIKCHICEAQFTHPTSLKTHMLVHSGERPFKCEDCGKSFARKTVLNIHRRLHTGEKPYQCPLCPIASVTKEALMRHMSKDHDDESEVDRLKYTCGICHKAMGTKYSLQTHMKLHDKQQDQNSVCELKPLIFSCSSCGKVFDSNDEYCNHVENHDKHQHFQCDICQETFDKKFKLLFHLQTHKLEDMPCKKCGEVFSIKEDLIQHTRTHFDKRNLDFQCPECNIGLYDMRDLKLHMCNIHGVSMGNVNSCDMCSESYNTATEYHKHMHEKHDTINKTCNECDKYFDSRKAFDKHILIHYM